MELSLLERLGSVLDGKEDALHVPGPVGRILRLLERLVQDLKAQDEIFCLLHACVGCDLVPCCQLVAKLIDGILALQQLLDLAHPGTEGGKLISAYGDSIPLLLHLLLELLSSPRDLVLACPIDRRDLLVHQPLDLSLVRNQLLLHRLHPLELSCLFSLFHRFSQPHALQLGPAVQLEEKVSQSSSRLGDGGSLLQALLRAHVDLVAHLLGLQDIRVVLLQLINDLRCCVTSLDLLHLFAENIAEVSFLEDHSRLLLLHFRLVELLSDQLVALGDGDHGTVEVVELVL
mmetsp:Transcript_14292/g.48882  ORF Transcript_14292/g.48882 Transcript_14292/m.48882 type:complete len:288 (+) Transcript_14292:3411-4274(+)